jgi:HD-like signal output (HDOD) protein
MRRLQMRLQTPPSPAEAQVLSGALLRANVDRLFGSSMYRPPILPVVALRILEQSRKPNVSYSEIVDLVESDPLFAASVLKIASSPVYASKAAIRSIEQALLRLGLTRLVDVCLEVALTGRLFRAPGFETAMEKLRKHSVAVAHIARLVADRAGAAGDDTFTLGLLHEVGIVAGMIALSTPALWPDGVNKSGSLAVIGLERRELTERLVRAWMLPDTVGRGLIELARMSRPNDPILAAVVLADRIAETIGYGTPEELPSACEAEVEEQSREMLGLRMLDVSDLEHLAKKHCSRFVC